MSEKQLTQVFQEFGGERRAALIAKTISDVRRKDPTQLETVGGLLRSIGRKLGPQKGKRHPATKVFQALRIAVNDELSSIKKALPQALEVLKSGGKVVTIGFHEGEDRQAKVMFNEWEENQLGKKLTPKVIKPSEEEVTSNPRSRSAKLRAFQKK